MCGEARLDPGFQFAVSGELRIGLAQHRYLREGQTNPGLYGREDVGREPERKEATGAGGILEAQGQEGHVGLGMMGPGYGFHIQP